MIRECERENAWSIILAGGEGERLRPLVQCWLGRHKPKQYCAFIGTRSMFQHTLDRSDQISLPDRKVTVIAQDHRWDAWPQLTDRIPGKVILQPFNRDTAAGIMLALTYVRVHDPRSTVVIFPSDHFVYPEERFVEVVRSAIRVARELKQWLFVLGVPPNRLELEYGWIQQGPHLGWFDGLQIWSAQNFIEKPEYERCKNAMAAGALWNTLILAGQIETLWELGWQCLPEMMRLFERYGEAIGTEREEAVLQSVYEEMPARNFSSDLLERVSHRIAVIQLAGVLWCDWGKAERIVETLHRIGKLPAFPLTCAAAG